MQPSTLAIVNHPKIICNLTTKTRQLQNLSDPLTQNPRLHETSQKQEKPKKSGTSNHDPT